MNLSEFSVKRPITIFMLFFGILLLGAVSLLRLPVELKPNIAYGDISIIVAIRGGMPPQEVETLVTRPIEEVVGTVSYLENIYSTSKAGESRIWLEFEPGTNMDFAALEVREEFSKIRDMLPREIEKPIIAQYKESDLPVLLLAVTGEGYTPEMLRKVVDEEIKERILRVEGVANVDVYGGRERKILVEVDKDKLHQYNVPMERVVSALGANNLNLLAGGIERQKKKYLVRIIGEFKTLEDIENIGIFATPQGSIIKLKEIAKVKDSFLEPTNYARTDIEPVVSIYIQKESTANTIHVVSDIEEELGRLKKALDKNIFIKATLNQANAIKDAIDAVKASLLYGAILAVMALLLFLRDLRVTSIISVTIPISVMATFIMMFFHKISINVMTLSGLALGIGMLVDNSIVVLDNIDKKKRGINFSNKGEWIKRFREAVVSGASEVGLAILASTITTIIVFLPFIFVNKATRMLWSGLALTVTYSLLSSLLVALTLVPMLSDRIKRMPVSVKPRKAMFKKLRDLRDPSALRPQDDPSVIGRNTPRGQLNISGRIKGAYRRLLGIGLKLRYIFALGAFVLFVLALILGSKLDREFFAGTEEGRFTMFVELEPGAKLDVTDEMVKEMENLLIDIPEIKTFTSRVEPWSSKIYVKLLPLAQRKRSTKIVIDEIRETAQSIEQKYKGGFIYFSEIVEKGLEEIVVDLYGYEYEILKELAVSIATRLGTIEGFQDIRMSRISGRPEWGITVDKEKSAMYGLSTRNIADTLHSEIRGLRATLYHTEAREVAVVSRLRKEDRDRLDDLRKLVLFSEQGYPILLEQVADFTPQIGSSEIVRKNKMRVVHISALITKHSLIDAVQMVRNNLGDMEFPKDYYWRIGGNYERNLRNERELWAFPTGVLWITIFLVYLVLASLFESYAQPFIIMISVPLAIIGVIVALKITDKPVSRGVIIGAIMLAGIVVNNAIVLVDRINFLRDRRATNLFHSLIAAGEDRLRPIAMTTSTTILGLVPMAFDKSESAGLWSPLAITVIGGMASSTILTLFLVPSIYLIFEDMKNIKNIIRLRN
ncbi:MAG: efflux RND transporter permease subunit [Candidatus Omnitrophica bacterium]|nr:efflux RND transporter permease subunit [Candidatus Omnitrophota bacterium]